MASTKVFEEVTAVKTIVQGIDTKLGEQEKKLAEIKKLLDKQQKAVSKKEKDPTKPKRGLTSFALYSNSVRKEVKAANPTATFGQLSQLIGQKWKKLTDEQKKPFQAQAEQGKEVYQKALEEWKASKAE